MESQSKVNFYVSTSGNDGWSGRLPEPSRDGKDGPFASIERARVAVRTLGNRGAPITVQIRGGVYRLQKPVTFTPEDSGKPLAPVTYEAFPGETPVLSGGVQLTGWVETRVNGKVAWETKAPSWDFHQIWANGERRYRPRLPRQGYYKVKSAPPPPDFYHGSSQFTAEPHEVKNWKNLGDVEIVALTAWVESRLPIASVDESTGEVRTKQRSSLSLREGSRYWVENVFEALNEPGQWYLDRPAEKLYYLPMRGETIANCVIVAPRLANVVILKGDPDGKRYVEDLRFRGLTFSHTEWWRSDSTRIFRWDIIAFSPEDVRKRIIEVRHVADDKASDHQAAVSVEGAVACTAARRCEIAECTVEHVGTYGIDLGRGCSDSEVARCLFRDLAAGGVKIGTGVVADAASSGYNRVLDCEITGGGKVFLSAVGVWIGQSGNNHIAHNHIHDMFYTGISVGWTWGYTEAAGENNLIEYNDIHDIGKGVLSDMGGIYTLGHLPGTVVRFNRVRDVECSEYGACGIYFDEGSSNVVCENNLVYHIKGPALNRHYGRENMARNNILALSNTEVSTGRGEWLIGMTLERNILLHAGNEPVAIRDEEPSYRFRGNLYWNTKGGELSFHHKTWDEWRGEGYDACSRIADPRFADPERGDFRLPADSPALELGFVPFDLSQVGPRKPYGAGHRNP